MFHAAPPSLIAPAFFAGLLAATALAGPHAAAAEAAPDGAAMVDGAARVSLIDGWRAPDGRVVAAISVRLAPGWHTYWRNPGDVGMPPSFDWGGSENLAGVAIDWPRPKLFEAFGDRSIGYDGDLVLPITLTPRDPSRPVDLSLDLAIGVCSDVCVPDQAKLSARFGPRPSDPDPAPIRAALADRPRTAAEAGVAEVTCDLAQGPDGLEMTATVTFDGPAKPGQMAVIESSQPGLWIGAPEARSRGRSLVARAPVEAKSAAIDRGDLRLTLVGDDDAIDIRGCGSARRASAAR
ncbi:protein-disulfide reductase DsbD domain-containing protein [Amaricoccus solimangrovi]|nr:protein-disulfide reductase DsbD domain-containing protein [Amaricoccus solimangrovi]